jgi:hypothetical protein
VGQRLRGGAGLRGGRGGGVVAHAWPPSWPYGCWCCRGDSNADGLTLPAPGPAWCGIRASAEGPESAASARCPRTRGPRARRRPRARRSGRPGSRSSGTGCRTGPGASPVRSAPGCPPGGRARSSPCPGRRIRTARRRTWRAPAGRRRAVRRRRVPRRCVPRCLRRSRRAPGRTPRAGRPPARCRPRTRPASSRPWRPRVRAARAVRRAAIRRSRRPSRAVRRRSPAGRTRQGGGRCARAYPASRRPRVPRRRRRPTRVLLRRAPGLRPGSSARSGGPWAAGGSPGSSRIVPSRIDSSRSTETAISSACSPETSMISAASISAAVGPTEPCSAWAAASSAGDCCPGAGCWAQGSLAQGAAAPPGRVAGGVPPHCSTSAEVVNSPDSSGRSPSATGMDHCPVTSWPGAPWSP